MPDPDHQVGDNTERRLVCLSGVGKQCSIIRILRTPYWCCVHLPTAAILSWSRHDVAALPLLRKRRTLRPLDLANPSLCHSGKNNKKIKKKKSKPSEETKRNDIPMSRCWVTLDQKPRTMAGNSGDQILSRIQSSSSL